jgi:hypothetical protein
LQNWTIILNLLGILRRSSTRLDITADDDMEDEDYFLDKVSLMTIVLDIFRLLYEACGVSWFSHESARAMYANHQNRYHYHANNNNNENKKVHQDWNSKEIPSNLSQLSQVLVRTVLRCGMVPHAGIQDRDKLTRILFSPNGFANGSWLYQFHLNSKVYYYP